MNKVNSNQLTITQRLKAPTPKFFRKLRTIGLSLAAAGAAIIASPLALPAAVITVAGYLTLAGTVASVVSQAAVENKPGHQEQPDPAGPATSTLKETEEEQAVVR